MIDAPATKNRRQGARTAVHAMFMGGRAAMLLLLVALMFAAWAMVAAKAAEPILTVQGGSAKTLAFTLAELDALPQSTITTKTPWYDGVQSFSGPRLADVLAAVGAGGETITARALNDYAADIPAADAGAFGVVLATRLNGKTLSVRDKGPIFIVYPYDADPKLQHDLYYSRSVWQVDRLMVK